MHMLFHSSCNNQASMASFLGSAALTPSRPPSSAYPRLHFMPRLLSCGCCRAGDSSVQISARTDDPTHDAKLQQEAAASSNLMLLSASPLPLLAPAALPGAGSLTQLLEPFVELVRSWDFPDWLVHWGHPGNMAVVLFAMGGYGSYLGWQIRLSNDVMIKANAKDLHPKLLAGMFFFFALGASGGVTSLLTSGRPILESPHAVTGIAGLTLLTAQSVMPTFFQSNPLLRTAHAFLGSGIMLLFLVHAVFGLQLGLSY